MLELEEDVVRVRDNGCGWWAGCVTPWAGGLGRGLFDENGLCAEGGIN